MNYLQKKKQAIIMMLAAQIVKSAKGYPVTIEDSRSGAAVDYTVWGNTVAAGKNLIPYPYRYSTKTINGITFTDNRDGTITANGTATADAELYLIPTAFTVKKGISYSISGCPSGGSKTTYLLKFRGYNEDIGQGQTFTPNYDFTNNVTILIKSGVTVENLLFKPQLELGKTATEYEPYKAGYVGDKTDNATDEYKIQIVNSGKNLIPYPYYDTTKTTNGVTFTDNGDGSVTVNGTAAENAYFTLWLDLENIDTAKKYVLSGSTEHVHVYVTLYQDKTWKKEFMSRGQPIVIEFPTDIEFDRISVSSYVYNGYTANNETIRPQLELGETATEYVPYRSPSTAVICRSAPLKKGESVNYRSDKLPKLKLFEGENIITATTAIKPEKISVDYYAKESD